MPEKYYTEEFRDWVSWIRKKRAKKGWDWQQVALCGKKNEESCMEYLAESAEEEERYRFQSIKEWQTFVEYVRDEEERSQPITMTEREVERGTGDRPIPDDPKTCWKQYYNYLMKDGKIPPASVVTIGDSSHMVLNYLVDGKNEDSPVVHGLVMGNVQSGKTANMEGLMSMAADYDWNVFIILSGTIENLRKQTSDRMAMDLKGKNLSWVALDRPDTRNASSNPSNLKLGEGDRERYWMVCLKNSKRLKDLHRWLNFDPNKKKQMRVLLIDDESDQASLNTKSMDSEQDMIERTRINELIMAIVNGNEHVGSEGTLPYKAMNYVAYTATPYGNVLNESGPESLYPRDFITVLPMADTYFGPKQIFGDQVDGTMDGLPIINRITSSYGKVLSEDNIKTDTDIIEDIAAANGNSNAPEIPSSLQDAVLWFCICVAIRRVQVGTGNQKIRPVTMLVHHAMKTVYHISVARAIRQWFDKQLSLPEFLTACERVYQEQTHQLTRQDFVQAWPSYGRSSGISLPAGIVDYPSFEEIRQELKDLKQPMFHITIEDKDGSRLSFGTGIHLCVDNCTYETVCDEEKMPQVRLVYPTQMDNCPTNVPAFLVVGGNTLSRGLTLEGLVCTYFSRDVRQADTLMQMGRWFGYRAGYELLPRIWMTDEAVERFENLAELDIKLRSDIFSRYLSGEVTPATCGPMVASCTGIALTARGKMQGAEQAELNFAGAHLQSFTFVNDKATLENNLEVADKFLTGLGAPDAEVSNVQHMVWHDVPYDRLEKEFFALSHYKVSGLSSLEAFCDWYRNVNTDFGNWEIILSGKKNEDTWHGVGKVSRSRLLSGGRTESSLDVSMGILADPNVWQADLPKRYIENLSAKEKEIWERGSAKGASDKAKADFNNLKEELRKRAGKANKPRLVLYCVDKQQIDPDEWKATHTDTKRSPLNAATDVIGIELLLPGSPVNRDYCASVTIHLDKDGVR